MFYRSKRFNYPLPPKKNHCYIPPYTKDISLILACFLLFHVKGSFKSIPSRGSLRRSFRPKGRRAFLDRLTFLWTWWVIAPASANVPGRLRCVSEPLDSLVVWLLVGCFFLFWLVLVGWFVCFFGWFLGWFVGLVAWLLACLFVCLFAWFNCFQFLGGEFSFEGVVVNKCFLFTPFNTSFVLRSRFVDP